jgi:hypothetical protein
LALYQHLNHEPQTRRKPLKKKGMTAPECVLTDMYQVELSSFMTERLYPDWQSNEQPYISIFIGAGVMEIVVTLSVMSQQLRPSMVTSRLMT